MGKTVHSCDIIEVETKEQTVQGRVMPGSNDNVLVLKLSSGYNIGIEKKKIVRTTIVKPSPKSAQQCVASLEPHAVKRPQKVNRKLPTISILHTGGTIASKVDYATGGVSARFTPEEIVSMFPELGKIAQIHSRLISNMWSDDMRFAHYNILAKEIQKEIKKGVEGVIITHGTDTLAHTAAALRFVFEHLPIPVLLVGSQRSSDRGSSDAAMNLICAAQFIAKSDFADVGICMHATSSDELCVVLPATKTRKMHTSRRDTFKVVNALPYAHVHKNGSITMINKQYHPRDTSKVVVKPFKENVKVGVAIAHPNMYAQELEAYSTFHGLILQGTGLGHFPVNTIDDYTKEHKKILKTLTTLAKKMPVFMTSQTIYGRVNMNVYTTGHVLKDAGVLGDYTDMLPETAHIKLAWLLSHYPKSKAAELMAENLRGEITKRSLQHEFLE